MRMAMAMKLAMLGVAAMLAMLAMVAEAGAGQSVGRSCTREAMAGRREPGRDAWRVVNWERGLGAQGSGIRRSVVLAGTGG